MGEAEVMSVRLEAATEAGESSYPCDVDVVEIGTVDNDVVLGPASDLSQKYEDVASVIARTTLHVGDVVDVSVPQAMTVSGP